MKFTTDFTTIGYDTEFAIKKEINESLNASAVFICKYIYMKIRVDKAFVLQYN